MGELANNKYIKRNVSKEWLTKNNFKYSNILSDEDNEVYVYRFPVHKNGFFTVLECEIVICLSSGEVNVDIFEYGTRDRYAPFYYAEYGNYNIILEVINKQIETELKKFGIRKKGK